MIIQRNSKCLNHIEEPEDYKVLKIQTEDEHNKLASDSRGNICFIGNTDKYRKIIWKDLFTDKDSDEISAKLKYIYNGGKPLFKGYLVCDEPLGEDEVIVYDVEELRHVSEKFHMLTLEIVGDSLLNTIKTMDNTDALYDSAERYSSFSRVKVRIQNSDMWLQIEKIGKNLVAEDVKCLKFTGSRCYAAYCNKNKTVIMNGNVMKSQAGSIDRLMVVCSALEHPVNDTISVKNCAHILGNTGYMYIEPFALSEANTENLIVEITANRQLPLEIYDENQKNWDAFKNGALEKYSNIKNIKLRIGVETGDYVKKVVIKYSSKVK